MDTKDMTGQVLTIEGTQAVCILQTPTKRIYAAVEGSKVDMKWEEAQEWCKAQFNGKGYCPDRAELMWLFTYYKNKVEGRNKLYWTSENASNGSWILCWDDGDVGFGYRGVIGYVRAFHTESLL